MLTRFTENIARWPRLFTACLVGCVLAYAESYVPRLVGVDARHALYANTLDLVLALVLAGLLYRWIFRDAQRIAIFLDVADRLEGRGVCSIAEHAEDLEENDFEEENDPEAGQ